MKKIIAIFGASGGLGSKLVPLLRNDFKVIELNSKTIDITQLENVKEFFKSNKVDIVLNLSGYNDDSFVHKLDNEDRIKKMIDVNIIGNINIVSSALPHMREAGYGRIILISSVLTTKVVPGTALYTGAKAFIDSFVKTVSSENIRKGITSNSIQLGYFDGGMCHRLPQDFAVKIKNSIGLKRWGTIEELKNTIIYLIENEYVTGQNINISGGL